MQQVNFGRIEGLLIQGGEPVLDAPGVRIVLEVKFGGENGPRAELGAEEFALKSQVIELLSQLDRVRDGCICLLTIKHGLPFSAHVPAAPQQLARLA